MSSDNANTWTETGITYDTAPSTGTQLGSSGAITSGTWTTVDVTSYITGDGAYNFAFSTTSSTNISFSSREGANVPELVIVTSDGATNTPTATSTPTNTGGSTPTASRTATPTSTATATSTMSQPPTVAPTTPAPFQSAHFDYDGDGKRVKSIINGTTTTFFIGNYYERLGVSTASITKYYYAGSQRIAMRTNGTLQFLIGDHLGSTSLVTDAAGEHPIETRYKAWGEVRYASGPTPTDYTFNGQYSHVEDFGLMFYNARWVDVSLGRFAQADTIIPQHQGVQAWDRYAYTNSNPVRFTDPTGHKTCGDTEIYNCGGTRNIPKIINHGGCGNLGQRRCDGSAPTYGNGLIGPSERPSTNLSLTLTLPLLPVTPNNECTPTHPCLGPQTGGPRYVQNPTDPDYWSLQGTFIVLAGSATIDRYGNVYVAPGVGAGSSIIEGGSAAFVAGWVDDPFDNTVPTEQEMEEFLQGPAVTFSGGAGGGGGVTWSPWAMSSGDAFASDHFSYEAGLYTPQIGVTGTWGFLLIDNR